MQNLATQMEHSYQHHTAFQFDTPSWNISTDELANFNENYASAHQIGRRLDNKSTAIIKQDCHSNMETIFSSLQKQSANEFETLFLAELKSESIKLLNEELTWYAKKAQTHFVRLEDTYSRHNAMCLQREKHYFGHLPQAAIIELRQLAEQELGQMRANAAAGKLKREDLSINRGPTVTAIKDILNREFKSLGVLDAVSAYTGRKTRVIGLALELSVPQASWWKNSIPTLERPPHTLYAHLDETISCPKSIVYLSDVTEQNGPTECYPGIYEALQLNPLQEIIGRVIGIVGNNADSPLKNYYGKQYHQSINSEHFRRHFMRLPETLRFNSHMGWDVMPNSEFETRLTNSGHKMTGQAGSFIIFDGARLFHRGGLIQQGERLALQVIFSDLTLPQRIVGKVKRILS